MNFISYSVLFAILSVAAVSHSESLPAPTLKKSEIDICAEKKLKDLRVRTMVSIDEEQWYLGKFKQDCLKTKSNGPAYQAELQKQIEAAQKAAQKEKELKELKEKESKVTKKDVDPAKPAVAAPTTAPAKPATSYSGPVFGGCGSPEQCAATMAEANKPKYTWSSPGLQVYLGELWGNNFNYAYSLGGTYEQPDSVCTEKNQGELIAFDMGTEVRPVACMSNFATQEEIKAMAAKIKTVKVETLPTVVAVKKPQYECKITKEPDKLEEGQIRICNGGCSCYAESVGKISSGGPGCGESKCIRIDGGPVKSKTAKKDEEKPKDKETPVQAAVEPRVPASEVQNKPAPIYDGYDRERDGAAGP